MYWDFKVFEQSACNGIHDKVHHLLIIAAIDEQLFEQQSNKVSFYNVVPCAL